MHYIGMDTHITTMDFAVVDDAGRLVKTATIDTGASALIKFVKSVPPPRTVYMEESLLASWVLETCLRFNEKLIITDPKKNHWIGSSVQKDDHLDAVKLAQLGRGGYVKEIHHPVGERRRFRELIESYHDTVRMTTRIKNKIKSKFRQNGIQCTGMTVYSKTYREEWRQKLPQELTPQLILDGLWSQSDQSEQIEKAILAAARALAKTYPEIRNFQDIPGVGFVSAATISAILETPHRFANKKKVWMYAGLGIATRESGGKIYSEKLSTDFNRLLKYVLRQATETTIQARDNPFRRKYMDLTLIRGIPPHRAKLTVARQLLATMWAMWKKGERYNPEIRGFSTNKQETAELLS